MDIEIITTDGFSHTVETDTDFDTFAQEVRSKLWIEDTFGWKINPKLIVRIRIADSLRNFVKGV